MEEISLRELIEIQLKQKKIIIGITIISMLMAGVVNFLILEPVYETRMVLMASNFSERLQSNQQGEGIDGLLNSLSQYPKMTMETYRQQVTAPRIMRETIKDLGLEDIYDIETLASAITLETIKDTNLITIKMRGTDPEKAATIVNKVGEKFVRFVSDKASEQATTNSAYLATLLEDEKESLDKALLELMKFLAKPKGTIELSKELDAKLQLITDYKTQVIEQELTRDVLTEKIIATNTQLSNTPQILVTNKSVGENNIISGIIKEETNQSSKDILNISMRNEEINPVYLELSGLSANLNIDLREAESRISNLLSQINTTQIQVDQLQARLAETRHIERQLQSKVDIAQNNFDAFTKKHEELRITESSHVGESSMVVISKAFPTTQPVGPKKMLNLAIATVLGLMMGVFVAFFIEYWKTSGEEKVITG